MFQELRIRTLMQVLDDEVHGLWISHEMAKAIIARLDEVTTSAKASLSDRDGLQSERDDASVQARRLT